MACIVTTPDRTAKRSSSSNRRNCPMAASSSRMRPSTAESHLGAALVAIDTANYVDHDQPTFSNAGLTVDAQELLVPGDVQLECGPSPRGRFASVAPLYDGSDRLLVTWSQCRLLDPASPDPLNPDHRAVHARAARDAGHRGSAAAVRRLDVQRHRRHATAARHAAGRVCVHRSGGHGSTHAAGRAPR